MTQPYSTPQGPSTFSFHCVTCKRTTNTGGSMFNADRKARDHINRFPDHEVETRETIPLHRWHGRQSTMPLFGENLVTGVDKPPF
jgi:hypothetical protein